MITNSLIGCKGNLDIGFIIDGSRSIREANPKDGSYDNWEILLDFVVDIIDRLPQYGTKVGLIVFSETAEVVYPFNRYPIMRDAATATCRLPYPNGQTNIAAALRKAHDTLFNAYYGDRQHVPNVAIVISDGKSTMDSNNVKTNAERLHMQGVNVICIGIGTKIYLPELREISSPPRVKGINYFTRNSFSELYGLLNILLSSIGVPVPVTFTSSQPCSEVISNPAIQPTRTSSSIPTPNPHITYSPAWVTQSPPQVTPYPPWVTQRPPEVTPNPPWIMQRPPEVTPNPPLGVTQRPPEVTPSPAWFTQRPPEVTPNPPLEVTQRPPEVTPNPPWGVTQRPSEVTTSPPWWVTQRPPEVTPNPPWITQRPPEVTPNPPWWVTQRPPEVTPNPPWVTQRPPEITPNPPLGVTQRPPEVTPSPARVTQRPPEVTPNPPWGTQTPPKVTPSPPWGTQRPPYITPSPAWVTPRPPEVVSSKWVV